ncbi:putative bifunctional diguanylate cyclase/phosphodiesterase [Qipengyuania sp. MTN3-11]|uniref:putative bifunctional diguanylate cyclase/phosphodiesterase n=1 Tax=Qipengyuania sp. MTN3-11 TaxID=3056557 RepID=UPI0036F2A7BB
MLHRTLFKPRRLQSRQIESEQLTRDLLIELADSASDAVLVADMNTSNKAIVYVNDAFEQLTGYVRSEAVGKNCRYLQGADRLQPEIDIIRQAIADGSGCEVRLRNYRKDGTLFWNRLRLAPLGPAGAPTHYAGFLRDETALVEAEARIEATTHRDALTGCLNRDGLLAALGPLSVLHRLLLVKIDVAHFHDINSGYGYDVGDALLFETARRLSALDCKAVARVGSDQFAIVFALAESAGASDELASVADCLKPRFDLPGAALTVRYATGYAIGEKGGEPLALVRQAGAALARSNANQLRVPCAFQVEAEREAFHRTRLTAELQHGIAADEFLYYYQPKIDLQTGDFVGAEALLRWRHGLFGLQSPEGFVNLAEDTGLILDIGARGFRQIAAFAARVNSWRRHPLRFAINVSAIEFTHRDMVALIANVLDETGADPAWLTLELTERLIATDSPEMLRIFREVRELGVGLSIDDFGTEYSSLRYLDRFPVTEVKIDRSFVSDLQHHAAKRIIVGAVIQLGAELGIDIVAEGIEQESDRAMLRAMNCPLGQGRLFSGPLSEEHFAVLARDGILPGKGRD